jgi:hypothetical protein
VPKYTRDLDRFPLWSIRLVTCDELVKAVSRGMFVGCPHCHLFIDEAECEVSHTDGPRVFRKCPKCQRPDMIPVDADGIADGVISPDTYYRVCEHCDFAFFWNDEQCVFDGPAKERILVEEDDGAQAFKPADHVAGGRIFVCPKCERLTS